MDKVNILLVDDQPGKLLSYQSILEDLGQNLVTASSGRTALQHLLNEEFALILLDVVMPEMDGFETAALIRERPKLQHTPIIFVTSYSTSDLDRLKGYEHGAIDFVFAPIVPEILRAKVAAHVELYRSRRELAQANDQLRQEIVERKRIEDSLRTSEERFRMLVDGVKDYAILMLDPLGCVINWNAGAERIFGYANTEVLGQHFSRFYDTESIQASRPQKLLATAESAGRIEEEGWRVRRDGSLFWANGIITALRDHDGALSGFSKVTRDLTERKRAEESLRQAERLAVIGEMVTGLAHESRNALQQIQSAVEMLARRVPDGPPRALVHEIQSAHDRMHHLFDEVRGYATPLRLCRASHDLAELWQEAWKKLTHLRQHRHVTFEQFSQGMDLRCSIDANAIEQLFRNIFENSLTATSDLVQIEVHCTAAETNGESAVRICIVDNGVGLNAEQKRRIFEPFYTTKTGGTGLGMAVAKRIVEAHGGWISVGDGLGQGTSIEIVLPRGET